MKLAPPLQRGILLRRYQRFFADVQLPSGDSITLHCPNTGSMKACLVPSTPCWYSLSGNPKRKLPGTLELTTTPSGFIVGVNTGRPNQLVREALEQEQIPELAGYSSRRVEVRYGRENSRIDLLLQNKGRPDCYIEVKNVTMETGDGLVQFPDAITTRGRKHLRELAAMASAGCRAVLFFCVQHSGAERISVAGHIDPHYARELRQATAAGVEILAYACELSPEEIVIARPLPFQWPG